MIQQTGGPIFIGGAGRSGTTLLRVMLDAHPNICCGPELKLLPAIGQFFQSVAQPLAPVMGAYGNTPDDICRHFRGLVEGLVENYRRTSGKSRWAEKTPHNVLFMMPLAQIFPDAKFLHVVRDGRDVACSLVTMNWVGPDGNKVDYIRNIANAAGYWRHVYLNVQQQAAQPLLRGRVMEIRYEQLVTETEKTMRSVLQFVDEPWDESVLAHQRRRQTQYEPREESSTAQVRNPVHGKAVGRWQNNMTEADRLAFKQQAGDLLSQLGYANGDW